MRVVSVALALALPSDCSSSSHAPSRSPSASTAPPAPSPSLSSGEYFGADELYHMKKIRRKLAKAETFVDLEMLSYKVRRFRCGGLG
jgi:hypothetical protein